jgi:hypothetical protein
MNKRITLKCTCNQYTNLLTPCCDNIKVALNDCNLKLYYLKKFREYGTIRLGSGSESAFYYCPYCGDKFPQPLRSKWYDILEKEYNLDDPTSKNQKRLVPTEFQTDEWWKKRGL